MLDASRALDVHLLGIQKMKVVKRRRSNSEKKAVFRQFVFSTTESYKENKRHRVSFQIFYSMI